MRCRNVPVQAHGSSRSSRSSRSSSCGHATPWLSPRARLAQLRHSSTAKHHRGPVHRSDEPQSRPGSSLVARGAICFPGPLRWCRMSRARRSALAARVRHARRLGHTPFLEGFDKSVHLSYRQTQKNVE
ncbi:hypothetical protein NDU88_006683 [Pleurodeles waltl]|uniref:Uncharacterized protein n=1 Tax=Pleurodeles waltl TaxID=8319 RepID=A0AAV7RQY2_PLEWA|nr:hypothetical protein NDU88_006683 [Pleurodeles waltl]